MVWFHICYWKHCNFNKSNAHVLDTKDKHFWPKVCCFYLFIFPAPFHLDAKHLFLLLVSLYDVLMNQTLVTVVTIELFIITFPTYHKWWQRCDMKQKVWGLKVWLCPGGCGSIIDMWSINMLTCLNNWSVSKDYQWLSNITVALSQQSYFDIQAGNNPSRHMTLTSTLLQHWLTLINVEATLFLCHVPAGVFWCTKCLPSRHSHIRSTLW